VIGFGKRIAFAFRSFFSLLGSGELPPDVVEQTGAAPAAIPAAAPPRPAPETADRAVQVLALLQRDGRLVDFLKEDITAYTDDQIGSAVRTVHEGCREALERYFALEPIMPEPEGERVTIASGFDPASIKVIGNAGSPPFRGVLQHRGWRVTASSLPALPDGEGRAIVAPAEVEIS
jgi:hypothetical protein